MTEAEAQDWLRETFGAAIFAAIDRYRHLLTDEAARQNLVSSKTLDAVWARHLVDSAQLLRFASAPLAGGWIDIGSGAGLPGIVVALASEWPVLLVEPRRLRAEFLTWCIADLGLGDRVAVACNKIERVDGEQAAVISARAVAGLDPLFAASAHLANPSTLWLLPKGASAESEVAVARRSWQGVFHVEQSIVDPASGIVVARGVARR